MTSKTKVLYIDDEVQNLNSFKASFRLDYHVLIAGTQAEALAHLDEHPDIQVVICDQRMPDVTGVELLSGLRRSHPLPVRMLITGFTDIEAVIDAINRGNIFRYIRKPWQELDLQSAIEEGHAFYLTSTRLHEKNKELQTAYAELDKFAYSVTHDLRGPILSALGVIDLARQMDDAAEIKDLLSMVEKAMLKLDSFIENTHDYYRLKRGELQIAEIDFNALVADIRDIYEISGVKGGARFDATIRQEEPFRSDQVSLEIVLNNLLSNAFKYQRQDEASKFVHLDVRVRGGVATLQVLDNGIGIESQYLDNIFEMFYRATTESIGSGFGLYNVKDALQRLAGDIQVNSTAGEGTTFTVTIPSK